jgi:hypothetical protein
MYEDVYIHTPPHPPPSKHFPDYVIGLDLGQRQDPTALIVLERQGEGTETTHDCRHIQRFPLGTSYPDIVREVGELLTKPPLSTARLALAIDETGVGAPVVELFRAAKLRAPIIAIHITGGSTVNEDNDITYVPKRELVGTVQVALQTDRLRIASQLPEAQRLVSELQDFRVTITEAANDTYGGRQGSHDDLVLALALALWTAKKPQYVRWIYTGRNGDNFTYREES